MSEAHRYESVCVDADPSLLLDTYRLRYQVYCVELQLIKASDSSGRVETDEFDSVSRHFAAIEGGRVIGTMRLVLPSALGLPMSRRCELFPEPQLLSDGEHRVAETSRACVGRGCEQPARSVSVLISLYRAAYLEAKGLVVTHWVVGMWPEIHRILVRQGLRWRPIGPAVEYWGPVTPCVLEMKTLGRLLFPPGADPGPSDDLRSQPRSGGGGRGPAMSRVDEAPTGEAAEAGSTA
jgi:N-acyl-L-homoserine lactone synthetase